MSVILWLCFTISGAAALALEMLWMRSAGFVLGQTAATTATVLACYFGGLSLGAASARSIRWRAVRVYGWLEIGAAAGALWSVGVFRALTSDGVQWWLAASGLAGRIAAVAVAVVPATLCLGATLPALGQALATPSAVGRRGGLLYALNTLGGAGGIAAMGFALPSLIGVGASYGAAASASALAGVLALTMTRFGGPAVAVPTSPVGSGPAAPRHRLRVVAAGAGALGLGLEVLWTRLFAQVLHNSVYSFTAIALVFLLAIALGAGISAVLLRRAAPDAIAAVALVSAAVAIVGGVWVFVRWTDGLAYIGMHSNLGEYVLRIVVLAAVTAGPAALASGMVLPALWASWGNQDGAARPLGDLSAANTFGGVAGAILSGFIAIPLLGIRGALLAASIVYLILADVSMPSGGRLRTLGYAALLGVVVLNPMRAPLVHLRPDADTLRDTAEGASGIVTVVESDGDLQLRLDNYYVLGGTAAATNERRLGLVPLLLHPAPRRVAFVGLATGITASAAPALGVDEVTVVEVVPEVAAAARTYFAPWNGQLLERPEVRLVVDDGRRFLSASDARFDVIVSDLFIPWHAGAGSLYSREMYQTVAKRLEPDGLFCQWLPLYQLTREEFDVITRTFLSVFPQASLWRADFYPNRPVLGLVGQSGTRGVELARVHDRLSRLPEWSRDPLLASPRGLAMLYVGDLSGAADLFAPAPLNTDDHPLIEFMAPRLTRMNATGDKDWFTSEALAAFYAEIDRRVTGVADPLFGASADVRDARRAGTALFNYAVAATQGDSGTAARREAEVRGLVPEVVVAAESTDTITALTDARHQLVGLRVEQEEVRRRLEAMQQRLGEITESGKDHR